MFKYFVPRIATNDLWPMFRNLILGLSFTAVTGLLDDYPVHSFRLEPASQKAE